jgi:arsenate reductase
MIDAGDQDIERALRGEIARLAEEFRRTFSEETLDRYVRESLDHLQGARVRRYLPTFAYHFARERLRALAKVEGYLSSDRPELVFVCTRNSGRSQMAAAFATELSGGELIAHSAGSQPADRVRPAVVAAMAELGIDLSEAFPKPLTDEVVRAADVVITMGCGDACPIYPYKKYEDWPIEDPEGQPLERVREIRDAIRARVERLLSEMGTKEAAWEVGRP